MRLNRRTILSLSLLVALVGSAVFAYAVLAQPDLGLEYGAATGLASTDIRLIAARIIRAALGLLGIVALALILYGGYTWMTAGGNEENIAKAKKILINAAIGLIIILSAYAIVSFIINALIQATTGGEGGEGGEVGPPGGFTKVLYITSMPGNDLGCGARNVHPVIVFNRPVDLATVPNNLVIQRKSDSSPANGTWNYVATNRQNAIVFDPIGDCGVEPPRTDCLDASTTYQIRFVSAASIRSQAPDVLDLNCNIGNYKKQCTNNPSVEFTTGDSVDVQPPTITILNPFEGQNFPQGQVIDVDVNFTDDFGLQNLSLQVNGFDVESKQVTGCQKSGTTTISWASGSSPTGTYALTAIGMDGSANMASDTRNILLRPATCYNTVLDPGEEQVGPPACCAPEMGCGCGSCAGGACATGADCASGYCEDGICLDKMMIREISPSSGAASTTYLSIYGQYFGNDGGHVYMTKDGGGWTEAFVASCGAGIDNWNISQIIVKVPPDAATGPLYVETASTTAGGTERKWTDYSNDTWGPMTPAPVGQFTITNELLPGLCAVRPNTGTPYMDVLLIGENFGMERNSPLNDTVVFSSSTAIIRSWADKTVKARVPALGKGATPVYITNEGKKSNVVRFYVYDLLDSGAPLIESITPDHGARGEYITITGKNFSNQQGLVLFKFPGDTMAHMGSFDFPEACEGAVWTDKQIIVKFPDETGLTNGAYSVQVQRSTDSVIGPIGAEFTLESGNPSPGICKIDPTSGPMPFATSTQMTIHGEYFNTEGLSFAYGDVIPADSSLAVPYYWTTAASSASITGRLPASAVYLISNEQINARPSTNTQTGPVVAYRDSDNKMGNGVPFTVYDCVANGNKCATEDYRCCTTGNDKGICRLTTELCDGETRSTGYMWRFNTGPFPPTPYVVERCDSETDLGNNLPSPAPNIAWTSAGNYDSYNACRTALVSVEFSMLMQSSTINSSNIQVFECTTSSVANTYFNTLNNCVHLGGPITMATDSYQLNISEGDEVGTRSYISMIPQVRRWDDNTWYHVVLSNDVLSAPTSYLFGTTTRYLGAQNLKSTRSCGGDSAYCFIFKTNAEECKLKDVIVTPYSYWTAVLEQPIKYRAIKDNSEDPGSDMYWKGNGLSDQHCILMDMTGFNWQWSTQSTTYANIYSTTTASRAMVTALANTVSIGLIDPFDAVNIYAKATRMTSTPAGTGGGLVAWWTFDSDTGTTVNDDSGNDHDGLITGDYTYVTGETGNALDLSGTDNYVTIANPDTFPSGLSPRSMCAWGKPSDTDLVYRWIAAYGTGGPAAGAGHAMFIGMRGSRAIGGAWSSDIEADGFWQADVWKHICLTYDGTTAKLYGNGTEIKSGGMYWDLFLNKAVLGDQVHDIPPMSHEFWKGAIDDVRIYNRTLSAEEVQDIYSGLDSGSSSGGAAESKTGESPLTIDLSKPRVLDYWPKCLEACPNAEVGAVFNIIMSSHNVSDQSIKFYKCNDENCLDITEVDINPYFDLADRRKLRLNYTSSTLESNTIYQVVLSRTGTSTADQLYQLWTGVSLTDDTSYGKPMQESFTWRFRTKSEACIISKLDIIPALFTAVYIDDRHVYSAEPRSAPDECDPKGQRLDPWKINWDWLSTTTSVAYVQEFTTKGFSPSCTANCLKKGSDVAAGSAQIVPLCGNGAVEAGEDCDPPEAGTFYGTSTTVHCTLRCLRPGNTKSTTATSGIDMGLCGDGHVGFGEECDPMNEATKNGCGVNCLHAGSAPSTGAEEVGASICGNSMVGLGEECDLGAAALWSSATSSMNCSASCLHTGSSLASSWCAFNTSTYGGFTQQEYVTACKKSLSQCGDGFTSPSEDYGCDVGEGYYNILNCTANCLAVTTELPECEPTSTVSWETPYGGIASTVVNTEGCGSNGQHLGSSLNYSTSSVCGDEVVGIGEDAGCETGFVYTHQFVDPWTLAVGVGEGIVSGEPPAQKTNIQGTGTQTIIVGTTEKTYVKSGFGQFQIMCGYKSDAECKAKFGNSYGLANNTCCYERANLIYTYPLKNDDNPPYDICPNTFLQAVYNKRIDPNTVVGNVIIARGSTATSCPFGQDNVIGIVQSIAKAEITPDTPWYKRIWIKLAHWVKGLFYGNADAAPFEINSNAFCAGVDLGTPMVVSAGDVSSTEINVTSTIIINLKAPLATTTDYAILIRPGVRDTMGVSVSSTDWVFITGEKICELASVTVDPPEYIFQSSGSSTQFVALATAENGQLIQPVDGYRWELIWAPLENDYVYLTDTTSTINTVTAKNSNGELDIFASTNMVENIFSSTNPQLSGLSHITVFLCENPWPPVGEFPFKDIKYDFKTYYCRDNGSTGVADDLPDISASSTTWTGEGNPYFKKYLFTNPDNKDAIGIQVLSNYSHLSIGDWFSAQGYTGSLGSLSVDGYDAISDGNNTYIDAIKLPNEESTGMYTNVYLFSINSDAKSETKNVYEQMMNNLKFNIGLPQVNVCGNFTATDTLHGVYTITSAESDFTCQNDLDCAALTEAYNAEHPTSTLSGTAQHCLNFKDKLQRNIVRLKDLRNIVGALNDYNEVWQFTNSSTDNYYPMMQEGSYLPGHALSIWTSSWSALGTEIGASLPSDPINKLVQGGTCFKDLSQSCYKDTDCSVIPLANRVSYWPIEDAIIDDGPLGNDGLNEGSVSFVSGKGHGKAMEFTGQSDAKFVIPHADEYSTEDFSVSVWIYPTKKNTATIIKKGGSNESGGSLGGFVLEYSGFSFYGGLSRFNNGTIRFALFPTSTDSNAYYAADTNDPLTLNTWHHIVAVADGTGSAKAIKIYVDGVMQSEAVVHSPSLASFEVAQMASNTFDFEGGFNFNGMIDNISYFDKALSATEVTNLYSHLCILHDAETGWSAEDRRFSFVCNTSSYAYRYIFMTSTKDFLLRANLETDGLFKPGFAASNLLLNGFVTTTGDVDFSYGICASADEISSPYNLVCGDGILGGDEECDPPGKAEYDLSACPSLSPLVVERKVCSSDCTWPPITWKMSCRSAIGGSCGDGKLQALAGESCDDGTLNGQLGRCNTSCNGIVSGCGNSTVDSLELCDTAQYKNETWCDGGDCPGWCVNGWYYFSLLAPTTTFVGCDEDSDCLTNNCHITDDRYGQTKVDSCNYDCKSRGEYCGDGIISSEWGEVCEADESCTIDGEAGLKKCTYCRHDNRNVTGLQNLWDFEWTDETSGIVFDSKMMRNATCIFIGTPYCPVPQDGALPGSRAYEFGVGGIKGVRVDDTAEDLMTEDFTVEVWIKPYSTMTGSGHRIIQKGVVSPLGWGGFLLWYAGSNHKLSYSVWDDEGDYPANLIYSSAITPNEWHHVALVYDAKSTISADTWSGTMYFYVDGELAASKTSVQYSTTPYPICMGSRCKQVGSEFQPDSGFNYYKGMIDEFYLYNIALSAETITSHYESGGWYCSASAESVATGECGDGAVDEDEVCDMGGFNGYECTPIEPQTSCTYCSDDCMNVITYTSPSTDACGNGIVDEDVEVCDINDPDTAMWRSIGDPPDRDDLCRVCKSDCTGWTTTENVEGSPCRLNGLGYCGDGMKNGLESCDGTDPAPPTGSVCADNCAGWKAALMILPPTTSFSIFGS